MHRHRRPALDVRGTAVLVLCLFGVSTRAQSAPDIDTLLARVSEKIADYYKRAQSVMCIEKTTVLPIPSGLMPSGFARVTESELRLEPAPTGEADDPSSGASFVRQIVKINGRPPREKDKKDRASCTDPNPLTAEPLAFLLPENREGYTFSTSGFGKGKDRTALIIEFENQPKDRKGKIVENERGIEDCFSVSIPAPVRGRVWVDAASYQVLRLESHLAGLGDVRSSVAQQRKHNLPDYMTIERYDTAIKYRPIAFTDPDEAMLLPESIETVVIWRNGLESSRRRQEYSDYRRFVTAGRIVK